MTQSLIDRFTYGNSFFPTPQERALYEITVDSPARQRTLISLAEKQIATQERIALEIVSSNLQGSQIIADEVVKQTEILENALGRVANKISGDISAAAEKISGEIEYFGDRLCIELSEIKWELAQQSKTLEKILYTLQENRNNETRQLVRQGIRHYINEEYKDAESRFKLALNYDTTDYQVLMNLAYIEIHRDQATEAAAFFRKALTLPENLDPVSKSRTLWAIARLHYTQREYEKALACANQSIALDSPTEAKKIFTSSVYAALSGKRPLALEKIEQAIKLDSAFFTVAAIEPDLGNLRNDILKLLSKLSNDAVREFNDFSEHVKKVVSRIDKNNKGRSEYKNFLSSIQGRLNKIVSSKNSSYSDYVRSINDAHNFSLSLQKALKIIPDIDKNIDKVKELSEKKRSLLENLRNKEEKLKSTENKLKRMSTRPYYELLLLIFLSPVILYFTPGIFLVNSNSAGFHADGADFILTILLWPLPFLIRLLTGPERSAVFYSVLGGLITGGIIIAFLWGLFKLKDGIEDQNIASMRKEESDCGAEISNINMEINKVINEIHNLESETNRFAKELDLNA